MKALLTAIMAKFEVPGLPLYLQSAPRGASLPYAVYFFINGAPDGEKSTFGKTVEGVEIQFSIWADTAAQALDYQTTIHDLYDDCQMDVSGYDFIQMRRNFYRTFKDGDAQQAVTTYNILIEK